jgi:hypothetical protein
VEQILNLRTDLMEAAEKLRRSEAERQTLETDIASLRQQVHTQRHSQHTCTPAQLRLVLFQQERSAWNTAGAVICKL